MISSALKNVQEIARHGRRLAVFLDYDGTLTPIVSHPEKALLSDSMRQALQSLVLQAPVAILSGRDLDDVRQRVNIGAIVYAGSHGFDIAGPSRSAQRNRHGVSAQARYGRRRAGQTAC